MRVRRGLRPAGEKIELNMTPMIDIVFQLLTFFIMSLRIAATEGDFQVGLPQTAPRVDVEARDTHRFRLRLTAAPDGSLRAMRLDEQTLATGVASAAETEAAFAALHREVLARVGDDRGPGSIAAQAELEIDCDYELDYEHVIAAITAVSGYAAPQENDGIVRLIESIKFAPPRRGAS
jgi:biopolymer transport protein ExbD